MHRILMIVSSLQEQKLLAIYMQIYKEFMQQINEFLWNIFWDRKFSKYNFKQAAVQYFSVYNIIYI
jgi:hypothetical protein